MWPAVCAFATVLWTELEPGVVTKQTHKFKQQQSVLCTSAKGRSCVRAGLASLVRYLLLLCSESRGGAGS